MLQYLISKVDVGDLVFLDLFTTDSEKFYCIVDPLSF